MAMNADELRNYMRLWAQRYWRTEKGRAAVQASRRKYEATEHAKARKKPRTREEMDRKNLLAKLARQNAKLTPCRRGHPRVWKHWPSGSRPVSA